MSIEHTRKKQRTPLWKQSKGYVANATLKARCRQLEKDYFLLRKTSQKKVDSLVSRVNSLDRCLQASQLANLAISRRNIVLERVCRNLSVYKEKDGVQKIVI